MQLAQRYRSRWVWPELGSWEVRKILCRPQREESGEKIKRKEFEFSCQVHVTSHRRYLFRQWQHRQETWKGSLIFC